MLIEKNYNISNYIRIILFFELPGYSEFLATFVVLNLFILIFFTLFKKIAENKIYLILFSELSLLVNFMPKINMDFPWKSLIIGDGTISFPILQYMSLFLAGIYFARVRPKFNIKVLIITVLLFIIHCIMEKQGIASLAGRFPPGMTFITGSYIFIYMYYFISKYIGEKFENYKWINLITLIRRKYTAILIN